MESKRPKLALWFRYGPAEHSELFHAMPRLVEALAQSCEVHYFGMKSAKPVPDLIRKHAVIHHLPFRVNRASTRDKVLKLVVWYFCLPWIGLFCRFQRMSAVYIDDYVPLGGWVARIFYGPAVACVVGDFHHEEYAENIPVLRPLARLVSRLDFAIWKRLPLVLTHVESTRRFLAQQGVRPECVIPVYDPCDADLYHPLPREQARLQWGYGPGDEVMVHHGILHPSKGMDWILRALAPLARERPRFRLLVVGAGPEMSRLQQLAAELRLSGVVRFAGWLNSPKDVNVALNAADVSLVSRAGRKWDDFHVTGALVHAMAVGSAVLAPRLAGIAEIVREGENGALFSPGDEHDFRQKLAALLNQPLLREKLGQAALADARRLFDMTVVVEKLRRPLAALASGSLFTPR
jgi:glycosyltransferase involved in cell wall biosynthesis